MSPREELQPPLGPWAKGTQGPEKLCPREGWEGRASAHLAVCRATVPSGGHLCTLRPPPSLRDTMPSSLAPHPAEGDFLFNYTAEFRSLLSAPGKSYKFLKALLEKRPGVPIVTSASPRASAVDELDLSVQGGRGWGWGGG